MTSSDIEKHGSEHIENPLEPTYTKASETINDARINRYTPEEQRKIVHRVDRRLVLTLGVLYCCSLVDRTNLSSANIAGMAKGPGSLNFVGSQYSIIVLVFFITYVVFQPPATVIMRRLGPRKFLSFIVLLWGTCMIGFGFVTKWDQMAGLRVILGVLEAGFFPGCAYLLSTWYTRFELQKRNAVFYLIGSMASACSGILAYGLMQMDGLGGQEGWRWIFIMEGILTCVLAVVGYFLIVDFPEEAASSWKFLSKEESDFMVARVEKDRHDAIPEAFRIKNYLTPCLDSKVWAFAALFGLTTTNTYAIAYFLPIILRNGMKFSIAKAQCLVAPPYVAAAFVMYGFAVLGDKHHIRAPIIIANAIIGLIGLPLLGYATNNGVRYFGAFLATISCNANIPAVLTYQANNIRGQWKRALCSATLVGSGGIGGIIGSTVFRDQDAPKYGPGIITCMISNGLVVVITLLLSLKFHRANRRVDQGGKSIEGQVGFKYTL